VKKKNVILVISSVILFIIILGLFSIFSNSPDENIVQQSNSALNAQKEEAKQRILSANEFSKYNIVMNQESDMSLNLLGEDSNTKTNLELSGIVDSENKYINLNGTLNIKTKEIIKKSDYSLIIKDNELISTIDGQEKREIIDDSMWKKQDALMLSKDLLQGDFELIGQEKINNKDYNILQLKPKLNEILNSKESNIDGQDGVYHLKIWVDKNTDIINIVEILIDLSTGEGFKMIIKTKYFIEPIN
jgi:hypothetical protein